MADNPFESMLPYQQMSAYKTRVLEIARLMMEHQRGITLQDVADKLQQEMEVKIKSLFQLHRSPDLVSSKFLYLWTWASCLKLYNPDGVPNFPLVKELRSESSNQSVCLRAPSTEYKAYLARQILEEHQRATKQEWQVIKSKVVEDLPPPVVTQIPSNDTPKPSSNKPSASNTPASPAVTKPQGNDLPKPSASPPVPPTSLPSPSFTKPQENDTPKPDIKKTGVTKRMARFLTAHTPEPSLNQPAAPPNGGHFWSSEQTITSGEVMLEQSNGSPFLARGWGRGRGRGRKFHPYYRHDRGYGGC